MVAVLWIEYIHQMSPGKEFKVTVIKNQTIDVMYHHELGDI